VAHVQIADAPGRNEPGTGELPIERWLGDLQERGYQGWVGLEYKPSGSSDQSFDWVSRDRRGATS
jgi:hydroxypyruvate isomerase